MSSLTSTSGSDIDLEKPREVHSHTNMPVKDPLELPYETLNDNANMAEFTTETAGGVMLETTRSRATGKLETHKLVTFTVDDKENPKNWSKAYKWYCTMIIAFTCFAVAFNSAVITADLVGVEETFGVSEEVALLTISVSISKPILLEVC